MKTATLTILLATSSTTIVDGTSSFIRGGSRITNNNNPNTAADISMVEMLQSLNDEGAPNKFKQSTIQYYIATQSQPQSKQHRSLTADNDGRGYTSPNNCWYATQEEYNNEPLKYHPNYAAGWKNGYCILSKKVSTSCTDGYDTEKECCDVSYPGQTSDNCYEVAGIERETEEPLGERWYPDRNTDPSVATCLR